MTDVGVWHSAIEAAIAFLCFLNAGLAWNRYKEIPLGLNALWCVAMATSCVLISIHAALSLADKSLVTYWVPWTWAVAHATLAVMLFAGIKFADRKGKDVWLPAVALAVAFSVGLFPLGESFSFVYTDSVIKRPLDFTLMIMWAGLVVVFHRSKTRLQLPGGVTHVFLFLGVLSHGVMAFCSSHSLDAGFMAAHVLKLLEVGAWTVCALTECLGTTESMADAYARRMSAFSADSASPPLVETAQLLELKELRAQVKSLAPYIKDLHKTRD